ncbi:MAG: D-alanyl-D-alanine carboxypeptidase [Clostridia bacterium]|nr:D-alanyl-D-alanine carboxypeptidase [Clostridia bacterium]MBQ7046392.1 D-alanyl-D-alanine carboxypeptidase [Oscillospiraceae bacterium]
MKKRIKFLVCFIIIFSMLSSITAFANYNAVLESSVKEKGGKIYSDIYILFNLDNDTVIFEKNADKKAAPASLTKIMTAAIVIEKCQNLEETVDIPAAPIRLLDGTGSSMAGLYVGEKMSVKNLLYCLLVRSGNDAANILAQHIGGTIENFVQMMNERAAKLGCTNTHFANAHGLDDPNHYTTARDLLKISEYALSLPHFEEITSTVSYTIPATNMSSERYLHNTNYLMNKAYSDYYSPYASGIKTGTTDNAGRCVISKGTGNGYNYLCVVMNAPFMNIDDDAIEENCAFIDCKMMFNWVFDNIELQSVASTTQIVAEVPLELSFEKDYITLVPAEDVLALVPVGTQAGGVLIDPIEDTIPEHVDAPVEKGQEIAEARVLYAGSEIARVKLVASESVSRNGLLYIGSIIKNIVSSLAFKIIAAILVAMILAYVVLFVYVNYKRRQRRKLKIVHPEVKSNGEYTKKDNKKKK